MHNVKAIQKINEAELRLGGGSKSSWHDEYSDSAYVFIGGLDYSLTEGDVLSVFSQYGEIVNINLVRDKKTGKSKGFCFLAYEDQRSTVLAVDNLNGFKLCGRTLRVDHVRQYRRPKDEDGNEIVEKGCAPKTPTPSPTPSPEPEPSPPPALKKKKLKKKKLKDKKEKRLKRKVLSKSPETVQEDSRRGTGKWERRERNGDESDKDDRSRSPHRSKKYLSASEQEKRRSRSPPYREHTKKRLKQQEEKSKSDYHEGARTHDHASDRHRPK